MNEETATAPTREAIVLAARALAGVCDGAIAEDGMGYNGLDSRLMKDLAAQVTHSDRQLRMMWHILRKYTKQLAGRGIQYEALVAPELPQARDAGTGQFRPATARLRMEWVDTQYGRRIALVFGYNVDLVNIVRGLEKRWFDAALKAWLIPNDVHALDAALAALEAVEPPLVIELEPELRKATDESRAALRRSLEASHASTSDLVVPTKLPLLPFQLAGVEFIEAHDGRAIVADEMGLGKTAQAIGWLVLKGAPVLPALVVCPAVVRVNWAREIARFSDLKALIVVSKSSLKGFQKLGVAVSDRPEPGYDIIIVNYDLCRFSKNAATINGLPIDAWEFNTVIFDESHYVKEAKAQRTKAAAALARHAVNAILLTGTPTLNRPKELWSQVAIANPHIFPTFFPFARKYCGAKKGRFGWDFNGATNTDELARILRERIMVRREKMTVLKELPDRRRCTIPIALNGHLADYQREAGGIIANLAELRSQRDAWKTKMAELSDDERRTYLAANAEAKAAAAKIQGHMIAEITRLRLVAGLAKVDAATDFVLDTVESAGKVLVFAHHHDVVDAYTSRLEEAGIKLVRVTGQENAAERQQAIDAFQNGDAQVALLSIGAGGAGLNLQAATNVIFVELPWRPGDVDQAEARAWRMGQKNAITTYFLVGLQTIEEKIAKVIDTKREVVNALMGETDRTVDEDGILDAILCEILG